MLINKWLITCCLIIISCQSRQNNLPPAENALDAGREFIEGCLKGDFDKANFYLPQNQANDSIFNVLKQDYHTKSNATKQELKNASITILAIEELSDKETIIRYSNSFSKEARIIKVAKTDLYWKVDLSYSINGNL